MGIHAARQLDQTLTEDAKKLVDRIVKRLSAIPVSATTVYDNFGAGGTHEVYKERSQFWPGVTPYS